MTGGPAKVPVSPSRHPLRGRGPNKRGLQCRAKVTRLTSSQPLEAQPWQRFSVAIAARAGHQQQERSSASPGTRYETSARITGLLIWP